MQVSPFPSRRPARVEMVPLIDMFFLLLVFFIYGVFSMTMQQGILVDLPFATTAAATKEEVVTISVSAEGALLVNHASVTLDTLAARLHQETAERRDRLVVLNADRRVAHGTVISVLDTVRQVGLQRVSFQTAQEVGG